MRAKKVRHARGYVETEKMLADASRIPIVILAVEGAQCLEGEIANIDYLYEKGVRCLSLTHLRPNDLGGTSTSIGNHTRTHGMGLTAFGREVMKKAEELGIIIDLAHASEALFWDVVSDISKGRAIVSHTGVQGVHRSWRNLSDKQIRAIAAKGGTIGIMFARKFLGGSNLSRLMQHIKYVVDLAGIDHVSLGSDFDGFVRTAVGIGNASEYPHITASLLREGFSVGDTRKILGGNFLQVFRELEGHENRDS